jgi:hypothetical protein
MDRTLPFSFGLELKSAKWPVGWKLAQRIPVLHEISLRVILGSPGPVNLLDAGFRLAISGLSVGMRSTYGTASLETVLPQPGATRLHLTIFGLKFHDTRCLVCLTLEINLCIWSVALYMVFGVYTRE